MKKDADFEEAFREERVVYLTTFDAEGKENTRPMINYSENPYELLWFPTERNTKKVRDIQQNPNVKIYVPSKKTSLFYEIEGKAKFEDQEVVKNKWRWWYLTWRPVQSRWFSFKPGQLGEDKVIINVYPSKIILTEKEI